MEVDTVEQILNLFDIFLHILAVQGDRHWPIPSVGNIDENVSKREREEGRRRSRGCVAARQPARCLRGVSGYMRLRIESLCTLVGGGFRV